MPEPSPVKIPEVPIVPIPGLVLLQVPLAVASLSEVVAPAHTEAVPEIGAGAAGNVFTVTSATTALLPQALVMV